MARSSLYSCEGSCRAIIRDLIDAINATAWVEPCFISDKDEAIVEEAVERAEAWLAGNRP